MGITKIDNIGIAVRSLAEEVKFFEEMLGFPVESAPEAQPPSATVHVGDQYLFLFQTSDESANTRRPAGLTGNPPGIDHLSFTVDDIDTTWRELRDRGVEFEGEPETVEDWGIRLVPFRDPAGNSFFLVQNLG